MIGFSAKALSLLLVSGLVACNSASPEKALETASGAVASFEALERFKNKPSQVKVFTYTAKDANKNFYGEPSPITITLFALNSDHRLYQHDFFELNIAAEDMLAKTYLDTLSETEMEPGSFKVLGP